MSLLNLKPVITEKSMQDAARSVYTFLVPRALSKSGIAAAVSSAFSVHVLGVTTSIRKGGTRRVGRLRRVKDIKSRKYAHVSLKSGEKIALFESKKD